MEEKTRADRGLVCQHLSDATHLPYGLTTKHVQEAVTYVYGLVDGFNEFLDSKGYPRLEKLILANSLSGIISEFIVVGLSNACPTLARNSKVGGHPDLLLIGAHANDSVLKGEGIEVKASIHSGGWQGHNPEGGWIMAFRYEKPEKLPITFIEILAADLAPEDWKFSGRGPGSRRTPTASILASGVKKLRENPVYRVPGAAVGRKKKQLE
ncbi:MAG: hypothetical protein NTW87_03115 [Planctomycetota bacterium]|nr:hypothetical protein [Planctomycetota bacterium]